MDIEWESDEGLITDPFYEIAIHIKLTGIITITIQDIRLFNEKTENDERLSVDNISKAIVCIVADEALRFIKKIMENGALSFFCVSCYWLDLSAVFGECIRDVLNEYGIRLDFHNLYSIEAAREAWAELSEAKERLSIKLTTDITRQKKCKGVSCEVDT